MPTELVLSILVPIFKEKGDIMYCSCYTGIQLFEHGMVVEGMFEKPFVQW